MSQKSAIKAWNRCVGRPHDLVTDFCGTVADLGGPVFAIEVEKPRYAGNCASRQQKLASAAAALRKWADALEGEEESNV